MDDVLKTASLVCKVPHWHSQFSWLAQQSGSGDSASHTSNLG